MIGKNLPQYVKSADVWSEDPSLGVIKYENGKAETGPAVTDLYVGVVLDALAMYTRSETLVAVDSDSNRAADNL